MEEMRERLARIEQHGRQGLTSRFLDVQLAIRENCLYSAGPHGFRNGGR
jgi:hypothetical protein